MNNQNTFLWILLFAFSAMLVNTIGIYVIWKNSRWAEKALEYFMCFAAGMLITSPLIMAFPNAIAKNPSAGIAALIGFVFMYMSNKFIKKRTKTKELAFGVTAIQGILIHSLLDGAIYTVTFSVSILTGVLTGLGLVVHEFAEGVVTFSMLLKSGISPRKASVFAFFAAALTTPIGALVAYPAISRVSDSLLGLALGFVAGVLIYISAAHLLPEAGAHDKEHSGISFFSGVALAFLLLLIK
ncbi:MAG: ZIP family metal transporter [Eubacteriales bacterium]|jgi:zinc transporter ZupT|nr:ZIP family metal transporter [Eubacteriales bacterium]